MGFVSGQTWFGAQLPMRSSPWACFSPLGLSFPLCGGEHSHLPDRLRGEREVLAGGVMSQASQEWLRLQPVFIAQEGPSADEGFLFFMLVIRGLRVQGPGLDQCVLKAPLLISATSLREKTM